MRLASYFAMRFIKRSKVQSALIVAGLTMGVAVLVITTWLVEGMRAAMDETYAGNIPHLVVRQLGETTQGLEDRVGLEETIGKALPGLVAMTPTLDQQVVLRLPPSDPAAGGDTPLTMRGLKLARAGDLYPLGSAMISGRTFKEGREIVVGTLLAERLSLEVGDGVVLEDDHGKTATFNVVGIFDLKLEEENASMAYVDLSALQLAFGLEEAAAQIELQLEDAFKAGEASLQLASVLDRPFLEIRSWETTHEQLFEAAALQRSAIRLLMIAVTLIIFVGTVLILSLSVYQRAVQLAVFKSLGLRSGQGGMVFALYAFYLSLFGVFGGIAAGSGLIRLYKTQSVLGISAYQQAPELNLVSLVLSLAVLPLASAVAARGVAQWVISKDPAEVIRHG
ncbi:ABC transporter permease [Acidaminobacter sp.]|uniref:ABC transporter permease n=1 Tax=Acidaminobacter sp. TaxID=1872102 RepID=UPI002561E098|nr:ABC transporter permease [Acidaminobacter sp.]MDK9711645.1 ABC transporter permease [Acidaminobacter sp.]